MKLSQVARNIESTVDTSGSFTMATNAKSFKILMDGLYQDKPMAIIREYMNNAWDSHVEAGKTDTPIKLHLPTALEPYLEITDYGVGLTDTEVIDVYTKFFESTKDKSNDYNGCFGLGSKSAFSYADSFIVTTSTSVFSMYINENSIPVFARMGDSVTPDVGVSIQISILQHDIGTFVNTASKFLKYFQGKVTVNLSNIQVKEREVVLEGSNWKVYKTGGYAPSDTIGIVMGSIRYPLNESILRNYYTDTFIQGLEVTVDLGDVDITPSRESLEYNKKTTAFLCELLQRVYKEVRGKLTESIKKYEDSPYAYYMKLKELVNTLPYPLNRSLPVAAAIDVRNVKCKTATNFKRSSWGFTTNGYSTRDVNYGYLAHRHFLVLVDDPKNLPKKIKHWRETNQYTSEITYVYLCTKADDVTEREVLDSLGNPEKHPDVVTILRASELVVPKLPKGTTQRNTRGQAAKLLTYNRPGFYTLPTSWSAAWSDTEVENVEDGTERVYVDLLRFKPKDIEEETFCQQVAYLSELNIDLPSEGIFGVLASHSSTLNKGKWVKWEDWVNKKVDQWVKDNWTKDKARQYLLAKQPGCNVADEWSEIYCWYDVLGQLKDDHPVKKYNVEYLCRSGKYGSLLVDTYLKKDLDFLDQQVYNFKENVEKINTKWPLLKYLSIRTRSYILSYYDAQQRQEVLDDNKTKADTLVAYLTSTQP